jgi:hypothetical protein
MSPVLAFNIRDRSYVAGPKCGRWSRQTDEDNQAGQQQPLIASHIVASSPLPFEDAMSSADNESGLSV